MPPATSDDRKVIASNRKARHDYLIVDTMESGIVLQGSEVKSLRLGHVQFADAYARVINGAVWLDGVHIPPYTFAHGVGAHDPDRARKLLLHSRRSSGCATRSPAAARARAAALYFKDGRVKVESVWAGRSTPTSATRWPSAMPQREMQRALGRQAKGRLD